MPVMDARRASRVIAQGLFHCGRRPGDVVSGGFSMSFVVCAAFPLAAVMIRPKGDEGDVWLGDGGGFSIAPFPVRESGGRQLTLLDRRLIEKEGGRSALRRRSSLLGGGCADETESRAMAAAALAARRDKLE